jgi:hypothetical protein
MLYRIEYTREYERELQEQRIFKYIDNNVLCDIDEVKGLIAENTNYGSLYVDEIQDRAAITDRDTAAAYIKAHRPVYWFVCYSTGDIDRLLCVEINDEGKPTAALYEHPEHGLIWLDMWEGRKRSWKR